VTENHPGPSVTMQKGSMNGGSAGASRATVPRSNDPGSRGRWMRGRPLGALRTLVGLSLSSSSFGNVWREVVASRGDGCPGGASRPSIDAVLIDLPC
jgi:hypothetical protein